MSTSDLTEHKDTRLDGLPIYYKATNRENPQSLIVFMPAALSINRPDRSKPIYSRSTWGAMWPESEIMAFADPALQQAEELNAAWFLHPDYDIIQNIADITHEHAERLGLGADKIMFYGSSLGGFGAIAAASCIKGARAVAEIPQIDLENWMRSAWRLLEQHIMDMPIGEYRKIRPEQLSLQDRLLKSGRVPAIRLITNPDDRQREEQYEFFSWARTCSLPKMGPFEFIDTTEVSGHAALPKKTVWSLFRGL